MRVHLVLALVLAACSGGEPLEAFEQEPPRRDRSAPAPAPAPEPKPADVERIDVEALHALVTTNDTGKPRIVNFWATWCGPCVVELPEIHRFATEHDDVVVQTVNVDHPRMGAKAVALFLERTRAGELPTVQLDHEDPAMALREAVPDWPDAIPVTLVQAPDGTVVQRFDRSVDYSDLEAAVAKAR